MTTHSVVYQVYELIHEHEANLGSKDAILHLPPHFDSAIREELGHSVSIPLDTLLGYKVRVAYHAKLPYFHHPDDELSDPAVLVSKLQKLGAHVVSIQYENSLLGGPKATATLKIGYGMDGYMCEVPGMSYEQALKDPVGLNPCAEYVPTFTIKTGSYLPNFYYTGDYPSSGFKCHKCQDKGAYFKDVQVGAHYESVKVECDHK